MRLIDVDELIEKMKARYAEIEKEYTYYDSYVQGYGDALDTVLLSPLVRSIEAGKMKLFAPRRINRNATYKCSVCGTLCSSYYNDVGEWKYCPHCGAKLEKEKTENE